MRPISLGQPSVTADDKRFRTWVLQCMAEIERASYDDVAVVANDFTVSNHTRTRTLDAATATLTDVKNVLCTFIEDIQNRGAKRNQ
jgi:hypothetical protein